METRLSGHGVYRTEYHIVWIPKYRRRILNLGVRGYISRLFPKVMKKMPGCEILERNIQIDHIHLITIIPPKYAVSEVIGEIKQHTASRLREKFAWLDKESEWYSHRDTLWQRLVWMSNRLPSM